MQIQVISWMNATLVLSSDVLIVFTVTPIGYRMYGHNISFPPALPAFLFNRICRSFNSTASFPNSSVASVDCSAFLEDRSFSME